MNSTPVNLLLADDDPDDREFFKDALDELAITAKLTTVEDGAQLMNYLTSNTGNLPDILFLDLNMPRKNGFDCLSEIKLHDQLKHLPVIIHSTSFDIEVVTLLHQKGAHYYIRKPGDYSKLKKAIYNALTLTAKNSFIQPSIVQFVLQS